MFSISLIAGVSSLVYSTVIPTLDFISGLDNEIHPGLIRNCLLLSGENIAFLLTSVNDIWHLTEFYVAGKCDSQQRNAQETLSMSCRELFRRAVVKINEFKPRCTLEEVVNGRFSPLLDVVINSWYSSKVNNSGTIRYRAYNRLSDFKCLNAQLGEVDVTGEFILDLFNGFLIYSIRPLPDCASLAEVSSSLANLLAYVNPWTLLRVFVENDGFQFKYVSMAFLTNRVHDSFSVEINTANSSVRVFPSSTRSACVLSASQDWLMNGSLLLGDSSIDKIAIALMSRGLFSKWFYFDYLRWSRDIAFAKLNFLLVGRDIFSARNFCNDVVWPLFYELNAQLSNRDNYSCGRDILSLETFENKLGPITISSIGGLCQKVENLASFSNIDLVENAIIGLSVNPLFSLVGIRNLASNDVLLTALHVPHKTILLGQSPFQTLITRLLETNGADQLMLELRHDILEVIDAVGFALEFLEELVAVYIQPKYTTIPENYIPKVVLDWSAACEIWHLSHSSTTTISI